MAPKRRIQSTQMGDVQARAGSTRSLGYLAVSGG